MTLLDSSYVARKNLNHLPGSPYAPGAIYDRPQTSIDAYGSFSSSVGTVSLPDQSQVNVVNHGPGNKSVQLQTVIDSGGSAMGLYLDGDMVIRADEVGGNPRLGFFGSGGTLQPATPTTLADVINALKELGLVAS